MSNLWRELHTRALEYKGHNDRYYLKQFSKKIPSYSTGCRCKEEWVKWVKSNPPVFGKGDEYFRWTVRGHNAINRKLGKKELTVEEAKRIYKS
jgi:hypothetical protein